MTANPFAPAAKPAPRGLTQKQFDNLTRATARFVHDVVRPLERRIEQLEGDLAYARSEAEKALSTDLTRHLGDGDSPPKTLDELNAMAAQFKSQRTG